MPQKFVVQSYHMAHVQTSVWSCVQLTDESQEDARGLM